MVQKIGFLDYRNQILLEFQNLNETCFFLSSPESQHGIRELVTYLVPSLRSEAYGIAAPPLLSLHIPPNASH